MRNAGTIAAAALLAGAACAGTAWAGGTLSAPRGEAIAGGSALARSHSYPTTPSGGRSDFRHARFARFGGASDGAWGFDHQHRPMGFHRDHHREGYPFAYGPYAYGYGVDLPYGYGSGPHGPEEPYGDSAGEVGYPPIPPPYAPALAQGPYGPGAYPQGLESPYRGPAYVSGGGAYAYGYNGFAETPVIVGAP